MSEEIKDNYKIKFRILSNLKIKESVLNYKPNNILFFIKKMNILEKQLEELNKIFFNDPLIKMWDNEYDEKWNNC